MRVGVRGGTAGAAVQHAPSPARSAGEPGLARRTVAIVKVRTHSTDAAFGGLSRRPSPLTSREPTSQLQVRWAGATELNPWQGAVMEGSEIFLAALFDRNLKDQSGGLRRNVRVGEDGLHSGRVREGLCRRQLNDDKSDDKQPDNQQSNDEHQPCTYMYTCMHVYMYTCIHVYMYTCMHICIYA